MRVMVECILDNTDDAIAEMFGLPVDAVRRVLALRKRPACSAPCRPG
jgi:hypothetical protein